MQSNPKYPMVALKRFAQIVNGGTPSEHCILPATDSAGHLWATPADMDWATPALAGTARKVTTAGLQATSGTIQPGAVLVSCRAPVGKVALLAAPLAFNQGCKALIPNEKLSYSRYLYFAMQALRSVLENKATGTTFKEINTESLKEIKVPLPPLETQKLIASYLDAKVGLMRLHAQMDKVVLHRLKAYRQALISEVISFGIPSENDASHPSLDTKKTSPWPMVALKRFASFETGATPPSKEEQWYAPGIPWATIGDLKATLLTETKKQVTAEAVAKFAIPVANPGDLLFSFKLSVGATAISAIKTATNEAIAIFRPSSRYCLQWAKYAFAVWVPRNAIANIYDAPLLNAQRIRNARVPLPPLDEQRAIAAYLDDKIGAIDQMIAIQERRPALHEGLISTTISEAVSGEFEPSAELIAQLSAKLDFAYQQLTAKSLADPLAAKHMRHLIPGLAAALAANGSTDLDLNEADPDSDAADAAEASDAS